MATAHADDLKPSELRNLERSLEAIAEVQATLADTAVALNAENLRDRERALKKATSELKRAERALSRLPDSNPKVAEGLDTLEGLKSELDLADDSLEAFAADAQERQQNAGADRQALLTLPETADNITRMDTLARDFRESWQSFHAIDGRFTHGLFKLWDEVSIGYLAYVLANQNSLLEEARVLLDAYEPLSTTPEGARSLRSPTRSLREQVERFESMLPDFVSALQPAQVLAAEALITDADRALAIFEQADKERDTSALLNLNPAFPDWDVHRNRLKAHNTLHDALGKPHGSALEAESDSALERADAVSARVQAWQNARRGKEADALAAQEAAAKARSEANEKQAEQDRLAWEERRKRLDAEREAQHQRNLQLRQVTR